MDSRPQRGEWSRVDDPARCQPQGLVAAGRQHGRQGSGKARRLMSAGVPEVSALPETDRKTRPRQMAVAQGHQAPPCDPEHPRPRWCELSLATQRSTEEQKFFQIPAEGLLHLGKGPVRNRDGLEAPCQTLGEAGLNE